MLLPVLLSYRKLRFHTIINAPQDSFLCYRAGQSVMVSAGETFIGSCRSDKDGIFQTGMVYSTQQNKVRNRIGGVKISRDHNRAGILESCIKWCRGQKPPTWCLRIVPCCALPQSCPLVAYRGIIIPLLCSYRGGSQGLSPTYEQAHVGLDLLTLAS